MPEQPTKPTGIQPGAPPPQGHHYAPQDPPDPPAEGAAYAPPQRSGGGASAKNADKKGAGSFSGMIDEAAASADKKARPVTDGASRSGVDEFDSGPFSQQEAGRDAGRPPKRLVRTIGGYARRHPFQAATIASAAGFALVKTLPKLRRR